MRVRGGRNLRWTLYYRFFYTRASMIPANFRSDYLVWTKGYARFVLALAMAVFSSCSSVTVRTDHDPGTNFARYRTYAFGPLSQNLLALTPSLRAQIESSLTQGLAARGLR